MSIIYAAARFAARDAHATAGEHPGQVINAADRFAFREPITNAETLRALKASAAVNQLIGL